MTIWIDADACIVQRHDATARVAKNRVDLVALERLENVLCAVHVVVLSPLAPKFFDVKKSPRIFRCRGLFGVWCQVISLILPSVHDKAPGWHHDHQDDFD